MPEFKTKSNLSILSLNAIELKISPEDYGILDSEDELVHVIQGEFMYCDLAVDGKLIVTETQLYKILALENLSIHKIVDSIIYIHSLSAKSIKKFNNSKAQVEFLSIENLEDDDEDEVMVFKWLS